MPSLILSLVAFLSKKHTKLQHFSNVASIVWAVVKIGLLLNFNSDA